VKTSHLSGVERLRLQRDLNASPIFPREDEFDLFAYVAVLNWNFNLGVPVF
jgi:hypothetical protein